MGFSCPASLLKPPPKIDINEGKTAEVADPDCKGMLDDREIDIDLLLCGEEVD